MTSRRLRFKNWLSVTLKVLAIRLARKCTVCKGSGMDPTVEYGTKRCSACEGEGTREAQKALKERQACKSN